MAKPEQLARETIDRLLVAAGWHVCDADQADLHAARGVAIREFLLKSGHGHADYPLYVDGKAAGVIEAKKEGATLSGVEIQASKYGQGLPDGLPRWRNLLPFAYESTGLETRFTNGLDPEPRARPVFAFHKRELLAEWLTPSPLEGGGWATEGCRTTCRLPAALHLPLPTEGPGVSEHCPPTPTPLNTTPNAASVA